MFRRGFAIWSAGLLCGCVIAAQGCGGAGGRALGEEDLTDTRWVLVALGTPELQDDALADPPITLEFASPPRFSGHGGCNRYFGTSRFGEGLALTIDDIGSTRMACPPPVLDQETRYLNMLHGEFTARAEGDDGLVLTGTDGKHVLRFRRASGGAE